MTHLTSLSQEFVSHLVEMMENFTAFEQDDVSKHIVFPESCLKMAKESGVKSQEGTLCGETSNAHVFLRDLIKAIEYHEARLIAEKE